MRFRLRASLILLAAAVPVVAGPPLKISVAEYRDRVYASWLGQCIGNIAGLPHENQHIAEPGPDKFPYGYGDNLTKIKSTNGVFSDDDTDIEFMYLRAMEEFGPEPTLQQLAGRWKYHVRDRVWLANRAALAAMHMGYGPPATGRKDINPHWFQIDPQLVNEIWAVTAPGMVKYAAAKSRWAASIMDEGWGVEPTIHYGAMYSAAFFEHDVETLIDIGTRALPAGSRFAQTVEDMKALHRKYPNDWKTARAEMARKCYLEEPSATRTIWNANLNGAAGILALLYGQGDFQKTLDLACAMGFDADNQAATMSGLVALIRGSKGLPKELLFPFPELNWKEPLNDFYKNVTRYDTPNASLKDQAARMAAQGEKLILKYGGRRITENGVEYYLINPEADFAPPLEFPAAPSPVLEAGVAANYEFLLSGCNRCSLAVASGELPGGLALRGLRLTGTPLEAGVYAVTLRAAQDGASASQRWTLVVRPPNLAPSAVRVLSRVNRTDAEKLKTLYLSSPASYRAETPEVIRDGKRYGEGSSFYSLGGDDSATVDYFGYEWSEPVQIGTVAFTTGQMEEYGGWFESLGVEYQVESGKWKEAKDLVITPPLPGGFHPFNKPHFAEYLLTFDPVKVRAVRIIGTPGGLPRKNKIHRFTTISELGVYGPLPNYQRLEQR